MKVSRPVLRGGGAVKATSLPGPSFTGFGATIHHWEGVTHQPSNQSIIEGILLPLEGLLRFGRLLHPGGQVLFLDFEAQHSRCRTAC